MLAVPAAAYLLVKPKASDGHDLTEIADLGQISAEEPKEIVYTRTRLDGWKQIKEKTSTWVVKKTDNSVLAFAPQCTHLGCAYHWESESNRFACPCHNSSFDADGRVLGGPAPRPLDRYPVKIEGGKILIGSEVEKTKV